MPLLVLEQGSEAWHDARFGKITASIAPAALGFNGSRALAWRRALGMELQVTGHAQQWGKEMEPRAREEYEEHSGSIVACTGFWVHPELDWLGASPDGLIGSDGLVEIKCTSKPPAAIPDHYRVQMIVQMAVTGREWCDLWSWAGPERTCLRLQRNIATETVVIDALRIFKEQFIDARVEPPRKKRGEVLFALPPI
jgi:putative phage-type endonuclease